MIRLMRPAAAVLVLVVATSAGAVGCTYLNPPALAISESSDKAPYFTLSAKDMRSQVDAKLKSATRTSDPTSMSTSNVADFLSAQVELTIQRHELDRRSITISDADKSKAQQALASSSQSQSAGGQSPTPSVEAIEFQAGSTLLRDRLVSDAFQKFGQAKRDLLAHGLYDDAVKRGYNLPGQLCLHVIVITAGQSSTSSTSAAPPPTEAELAAALSKAVDAKKRIGAGEAFETVADSVSSIAAKNPGGDLKCRADSGSQNSYPAELVKLLADVPAGSISEPKLFSGSYIVVRVDKRDAPHTPSFDEVKTQAEGAADQQLGGQLLAGLKQELMKTAIITIDPQFGKWDPANSRVNPPDGAATPTNPTTSTPTPALDAPSTSGVSVPPTTTPATRTPGTGTTGTTGPTGSVVAVSPDAGGAPTNSSAKRSSSNSSTVTTAVGP